MSNETIIVTKKNQTISHAEVGRIIVRAPGFTGVHLKVIGTGTEKTNVGLIDCTNPHASAHLENVLIEPAKPSLWLTGVMGHHYSAENVEVYRTVDGFGVYNKYGPEANVVIDGCTVDDLMYFTKDPNHKDRHTHNDAVQIQGGSSVIIRNSTLRAMLYNTGPWDHIATGQAIGITPNVSKVSGVTISKNHLNGGAQSITAIMGPKGASDIHVIDNVFGRSTKTNRAGAFEPKVQPYAWTRNRWASSNKPALLVRTTDL